MKTPYFLRQLSWLVVPALAAVTSLPAQIPTVLTDKIYRGSGVIDLMKNASDAQLSQYFGANGRLLLGVDLNEDAAGNESSTSQGVAIKSVQLLIKTNQGSFSFSDILTNTTALLTEAGSTTAKTYYTLFGQAGSSQINGSTTGFDLSKFDDVLEIRNVAVAGTITSAQLMINFLDPAKGAGANESFFDFSGGFEDFALLAPRDAQILEAAAIGTTSVSGAVSYTSTTVSPTYYIQPSPSATTTTTSTSTTTTTPTTSSSSPSTTSDTSNSTTTVATTDGQASTVQTSTNPTTTASGPTTTDTSPTPGVTTASTTTTSSNPIDSTPTTNSNSTTTTSTTTSVALAAPGAPEPSLVLLGAGAVLIVLASARGRLVRRA